MKKFESLEEVAQALRDGGSFNPNAEYETVEALVDALVDLGNTDEVFARHDDHMGLKSNLPDDFLRSPLSDVEKPEFESAIEAVIDQADIIIPLSERQLSEEEIEEIREDKLHRGEEVDD